MNDAWWVPFIPNSELEDSSDCVAFMNSLWARRIDRPQDYLKFIIKRKSRYLSGLTIIDEDFTNICGQALVTAYLSAHYYVKSKGFDTEDVFFCFETVVLDPLHTGFHFVVSVWAYDN